MCYGSVTTGALKSLLEKHNETDSKHVRDNFIGMKKIALCERYFKSWVAIKNTKQSCSSHSAILYYLELAINRDGGA